MFTGFQTPLTFGVKKLERDSYDTASPDDITSMIMVYVDDLHKFIETVEPYKIPRGRLAQDPVLTDQERRDFR